MLKSPKLENMRETIKYYDGSHLFRREIKRLDASTPFTEQLVSLSEELLIPLLRAKGLKLDQAELAPTYFVQPDNRREVGALVDVDPDEAHASYFPDRDIIIQFLTGDEVADTENYYHEQIHGLGRGLTACGSQDRIVTLIGYRVLVDKGEDFTERGEFLEEAVVDDLAAEVTVEHFRRLGLKISKREVIVRAGHSHYLAINRQLRRLIRAGGPELSALLCQARFEPKFIRQLCDSLNRSFGRGAAREIFKLEFDPEEVAQTVHKLRRRSLSTR